MKKIISMFCTLAMVLSMAVVAHADENNYVEFKLVSKEGGNAVVDAILHTNENIVSMAMFWDIADSGATNVSVVKGTCSNATYTKAQNQIMANYTSVEPITGDITVATYTFEGVTENFEISLKPLSARTKTFFKNSDNADVTSKFTTATQTIVLADPEPEKTLTATVNDEIKEIVGPSGNTTYGISGVVSGGAFFNTLVLTVNELTNGKTAEVDFNIGTAIEANDITFGLNIWGAPADIDFSATAAASLVATAE